MQRNRRDRIGRSLMEFLNGSFFFEGLTKLARGDMRRALNILQSTSMAFDVINQDNIYVCTGPCVGMCAGVGSREAVPSWVWLCIGARVGVSGCTTA